jgi:NAD-dependent deacetylase sirtuin 2
VASQALQKPEENAITEDMEASQEDIRSAEAFISSLEESGIFDGQPEALLQLRALAAQGIHPLQVLQSGRRPEEEPRECMLDSFDLRGIANYALDHRCQRVVVLCGAGISTSAGIPDFRSPGTGLYDNLQRYNLSRPEQIFELNFFREQPAAFYELCNELWPGRYEPTPAHYFLRLLHDKGILLRCYTQNIDSLEGRAGLPAEKLVAAHGNFDAAHVIDTHPEEEVEISELKAALDDGPAGWQALKEKKGNLVKPKIVFFGEQLPERFVDLCQGDLESCDMLIVLGTSLVVQPFCGLVGRANTTAPRLLVNREPVGTCDTLEFGFRFCHPNASQGANWRDVWYEGDCDTGARELSAAFGWEAELETLIDSKGAVSASQASWMT